MSANAAAKKQKPLKRHPSKLKRMSAYMILTLILISIVAVLFAFPLYWIITGSFKTVPPSTPPPGMVAQPVGADQLPRSCFPARAPRCGSWLCPLAPSSALTASPSTSR